MTIQRQYQLPNCTLKLEGMSQTTADTDQMLRPSLDLLMRFECQLMQPTQSLVGGLELLQSLMEATSQCTQEWMSGIHHMQATKRHLPKETVTLQRSEDKGFRLMVPTTLLTTAEPDATTADEGTTPAHVVLQLSTVQLFDLVEALDQLIADSQTLPNLAAELRPLSRRQAAQGEPLVKRATPLALGTGSLAIATAALFFLPVPKVSPPPEELLLPPTPTESPRPGAAPPLGSPTTSPTPPANGSAPATSTSPQPQ